MDSLENLLKSSQDDLKRSTPSDWNWNKSGAACIADLLKTGFLSDLTLCIGTENEEVKVHRLVLQMASQTFYRVFEKYPKVDKLEIADVDCSTFKIFLEFLYSCSGSKLINLENAEPLLDIATKYEIEELAQICTEILKQNFTNENVCKLLQKGMDYGNKELVNSALLYFSKEAWKIIKKDEFLKLGLDSVYEIVQRNDLGVNSEIQLFDAVVRWGEAECERKGVDPDSLNDSETNLKKEIKKLIPSIRFPLMDEKEFMNIVLTKQILTMEDGYTVMCLQKASLHGLGGTAKFNAEPRKYYPEPCTVKFEYDDDYVSYLRYNIEELNIKVNENVSLVGIKFLKESFSVSLLTPAGRKRIFEEICWDKFEAEIIIREDIGEQKKLFQLELKPFDPRKMMEVLFETAVPFKAGIQYCMKISFSGTLLYLQREWKKGDYHLYYFATNCSRKHRMKVNDKDVVISFHAQNSHSKLPRFLRKRNGSSRDLIPTTISGLLFNSFQCQGG